MDGGYYKIRGLVDELERFGLEKKRFKGLWDLLIGLMVGLMGGREDWRMDEK